MPILVVDDDLSQRVYLAALLRKSGREPVVCADGAAALAILADSAISLLIADVEMPGIDGLELCRRVRARNLGRYVYILLVTGRGRPDDYVAGLEAGADDFMPKPVDPSFLAVRLKSAERMLAYEGALQANAARLAAANERIHDDLVAAGTAQRAILPQQDCRIESCSIHGQFIPSQSVSGDVFNYFQIDEGEIGFYAADVAGHGVRPALTAVSLGHLITPDYFRQHAASRTGAGTSVNRELRPDRLAAALNRRFIASDTSPHLTLLCGIVDVSFDRVVLCQAGHPPPLIVDAGGAARWAGESGLPIGLLIDAEFEALEVPFRVGDRLIVYSDGVVEAANAAGEVFGESRLMAVAAARRGQSPAAFGGGLMQTLSEWCGGAEFADDVSMIVLDREQEQ